MSDQPAPPSEPYWRRRLTVACQRLAAGQPEQVTCLLPMQGLTEFPEQAILFLHFLMRQALAEAHANPASPLGAVDLIAAILAFARDTVRPVSLNEMAEANSFFLRCYEMQPSRRRTWVHSSHRTGTDKPLLMAESFLAALYPRSTDQHSQIPLPWKSTINIGVNCYYLYRTCVYYVMRRDSYRYYLDQHSVPRLGNILDWWMLHFPDARPTKRYGSLLL